MNEQEFNALFGETGPEGRPPTICAVTGQRLRKTDHLTRQRIAGTNLYVMHTLPLSAERLEKIVKVAKAGPKPEAATPTAAAKVKETNNGE